jgi:transcriptional regulator with XRE-family HTH domain
VQAKPAANGLRQLRQERGLTLQAVSVLSGITAAEASMLERGLIQPRPETIVKLARGLGVSAYRMRDILTASSTVEPEPAGAEP